MRAILGFFVLLLGLGLAPVDLVAQEEQTPPPPRQAPDTAELIFEREVFSYPSFERRNPFVPLVGNAEGGPRYEDLVLLGVLYSSDPDLSVALFGMRGEMQAGDQPQQRQGARRTFRARRGETLGNVRILEIQRTRVIVEVDEFGLTEQRIMEMQRPGQGGSS